MVKINFDTDYSEKTSVAHEDKAIDVLSRISYEEKEDLAAEFAERVLVLEEDGTTFRKYNEDAIKEYLMCKYYTNMDLTDIGEDYGRLHDFLMWSDLREKILMFCVDDWNDAQNICHKMLRMMEDIWQQRHSIRAILTNALSDETIAKVAHMREINEEMIDLVQKNNEGEIAKPIDRKVTKFPEFAKKNDK